MDALFKYLADNPTIATVLVVVIILVLFILLTIVVDAYRKGQPLSLWLIKIEANPTKLGSTSRGTSKKADRLNSCVEPVLIADRANFPSPFITRLEKAKDVSLLGINVNGIVSQYDGFIASKAKNGCKFRFLLVDSKFFDGQEMASALWPGGTRSQIDLGHSINAIEHMSKAVADGVVQLCFTPFPPPYTLLMINPADADGEIQVELYSFQEHSHERPHFILTRGENPHWYEYFYREFETAWKRSRPHIPSTGIKPVKRKAGVVVFRQPDHGKLELLLITARSGDQKWIFPVGAVDAGETAEAAAIRECAEESGYMVEIVSPLETLDIDNGTFVERLTFFLAREVGEKEVYERDRSREWVRPSQLVEMVVESFKPIADSALKKLDT